MYFNNLLSISSDFSLSFYFNCFKNANNRGIFNSFKALTICFDLVPKSLYSFIYTPEETIFIDSIST